MCDLILDFLLRCIEYPRLTITGASLKEHHNLITTCNDRQCQSYPSYGVTTDTNFWVPVMDKDTSLHYVSTQCAYCHNITNIIPWNVTIQSSKAELSNLNEFIDNSESLNRVCGRDSSCEIGFHPPLSSASRCVSTISHCPKTCRGLLVSKCISPNQVSCTQQAYRIHISLEK